MSIRAQVRPDVSVNHEEGGMYCPKNYYLELPNGHRLDVTTSGSGCFVEFEGTDLEPVLPAVRLQDYFGGYSIGCHASMSTDTNYVHRSAHATPGGPGLLIRCTELEDGIELLRKIKAKTARRTNLPMKQAVAVATRRKRRPLNPQPHCRRCHRPTYTCCSIPGGGRHYRMKGDR